MNSWNKAYLFLDSWHRLAMRIAYILSLCTETSLASLFLYTNVHISASTWMPCRFLANFGLYNIRFIWTGWTWIRWIRTRRTWTRWTWTRWIWTWTAVCIFSAACLHPLPTLLLLFRNDVTILGILLDTNGVICCLWSWPVIRLIRWPRPCDEPIPSRRTWWIWWIQSIAFCKSRWISYDAVFGCSVIISVFAIVWATQTTNCALVAIDSLIVNRQYSLFYSVNFHVEIYAKKQIHLS